MADHYINSNLIFCLFDGDGGFIKNTDGARSYWAVEPGLTEYEIPQIDGYTSYVWNGGSNESTKDLSSYTAATSISISYNSPSEGFFQLGNLDEFSNSFIAYKYNTAGAIPIEDLLFYNRIFFVEGADDYFEWKNPTPADEEASTIGFSGGSFSLNVYSDYSDHYGDGDLYIFHEITDGLELLPEWMKPLVNITANGIGEWQYYSFEIDKNSSVSDGFNMATQFSYSFKHSGVIPYPGAIGNGELVILSSNPEYNQYIDGKLDPSGRVFDNLGIRVISDIVSDDGKREVTVTTTRGDYMPSPYDVLVRNTSVGLMLGDLVPEPGMMSWSSMSPFAPYLGYFHQDFPLFLESYEDGKYVFVNLFALKLKYLRPVDSNGSQTYHWIKACYDDFLKTHSFMLCYYLGATNNGKNYLSFYEKSPGDGTDWGGAPVVNDSLAVATVSDVLQQSIQTEAHGFMLQEGFMLTDDGQPWYFGTVYYDYTKTSDPNDGEDFEKRSISYINLQNEHILQYAHNGRDFSENPRIIRIWQSNADSTSATDRGYYGVDENAKVKKITDMTSLKAPQYSVSDVLISADETINATVFGQIKYALNNRDVDMSVVIDLANRYSSTMLSTWRNDDWTPTASFSNYSGWIQCDFSDEGTPPVILQFKQMDFIAQTMLLATNNDIILKERV